MIVRFRLICSLAVLGVLSLMLYACTRSLPEPESEGAQLYPQYCSGSGCHGPIPPERGGERYWVNQTERMLQIMARASMSLPTAQQKSVILEYLFRNAEGAEGS